MKKAFILLIICAAVFSAPLLSARAEDDDNGDTGTSAATTVETPDAATSSTASSSAITVSRTGSSSVTTGSTTVKTSTILSFSVTDNACTASLRDAFGHPVAGASLQFDVDGTIVYALSDDAGKATVQVTAPQRIVCKFNGSDKYLAASASWTSPDSDTLSSSPDDVTAGTTQGTSPYIPPVGNLTEPSVGTMVISGSDDTGSGDLADDVTDPSVPIAEISTKAHSNWISTLMIAGGILLFIGAGLMIFFFVIRREKVPEEETAPEAVGPPSLDDPELPGDGEFDEYPVNNFNIDIDMDDWKIE